MSESLSPVSDNWKFPWRKTKYNKLYQTKPICWTIAHGKVRLSNSNTRLLQHCRNMSFSIELISSVIFKHFQNLSVKFCLVSAWFWRVSLVSLTITSQHRTDDEYNDRNSSSTTAYGNGWENIEKHLSMKKTIRKKMMRDLQQAFIDSQNPPDQQWNHVQMVPSNHKSGEPNLLEMLKANPAAAPPKSNQMTESQKIEPTTAKKPGFWKKLTMRKNKRWFNTKRTWEEKKRKKERTTNFVNNNLYSIFRNNPTLILLNEMSYYWKKKKATKFLFLIHTSK